MPLDKFVLLLVIVVVAAAITVWVGTLAAASMQVGGLTWLVFIPVSLVAYVVWRVISDRLSNREDDHYDNIKK